ncbi:MAG: serine/threonine-protein kinase [Nannocystaceae bacterium]
MSTPRPASRPATRPVSGASLGLTPIPADDGAAAADLAAFEGSPTRRYVAGALIGRGGMGEIRTTYDTRLGRTVALKTPVDRDGIATRQLVAEATLTARLVHPGIVAVHDAGRTPDGRPYYTMPIVQGRSLAEAIAQASADERLGLVRHFLDACEAVAYAHGQGVLHRDLKPSNILVGRFGETIVVDWGLAGPTGERPRAIVGTPRYMAPEQARAEVLGPPADVYALGVTLRELVTGSSHGDPDASSPPELLAIVERATADRPADRYPDGRAIARDVAAWFEGRRVAAHRYSARELLARVWAAHRVPLLAGLLAVLGIAIAVAIGVRRAAIERARALESEDQAVAARRRAERSLAQAETAQALSAIAEGAWPQAELLAAGALQHAPSAAARGVLTRFDSALRPRLQLRASMPTCTHLAVSERGEHVACGRDHEVRLGPPGLDWEQMQPIDAPGWPIAVLGAGREIIIDHPTRGLRLVDTTAARPPFLLHEETNEAKVAVPDDSGAFGWTSGTSTRWWDPETRSIETTRWCQDHGRSISGVVGLRSDGTRIAVCLDGGVFVDDGTGPRERMDVPSELGGPVGLAFAGGDSSLLAVGLAGGGVAVIDLDSSRIVRTFSTETGTPFDLALTDSRVALSDGRDSVYVWELDTGALLVRLPAHRARVRWVDGGEQLRIIGDRMEQWQLPSGRARPHVQATGSGIAALSVSADGLILSAHGDGHIRVGRVDDDRALAEIPLHWSVAKDVELSPDGRHAVAICAQAEQLFFIDLEEMLATGERPARTGRRVSWLLDDRLLLGPYEGGMDAWQGHAPLGNLLPDPEARVLDMATHSDRRSATAIDKIGRIYRVSHEPGSEGWLVAQRPGALEVAADARTTYLVTASSLQSIDHEGGLRSTPLVATNPTELALSGDGRLLAVGHGDGHVWIWSAITLEPIAVLPGHTSRVSALAFDPAGQWLISGSWDGDIRQWSLRSLLADPEVLLAEAERAWGLTLDGLLETGARPLGGPG